MSWLAIGVGAAVGAWLRWGLALVLHGWHNQLPLGTVAANLGGAYLIGIFLAFFQSHPLLSPEWRLLIVTGFLGGLTTFSTFSAESMTLLQNGDYFWALAHTALHVAGSLVLCIAGYASYRALFA
ncbi:fluoride efflux transporter CrcB [Janthinobacterium sp. 17J80-10]|uniref:fluoride efflux transporter CrcB n=1 Tax=Janthinobacterium sp. 17J80-10 TaxID=2497863 RepID=UPI0010055A6D|nr:fluoride efflux transporter CrcB [Janthinobacterium sp. 17J80-10]QAU35038.1 fluoride efflux transporter CrcB [Janthinobacterium sp. 17J80-10]